MGLFLLVPADGPAFNLHHLCLWKDLHEGLVSDGSWEFLVLLLSIRLKTKPAFVAQTTFKNGLLYIPHFPEDATVHIRKLPIDG